MVLANQLALNISSSLEMPSSKYLQLRQLQRYHNEINKEWMTNKLKSVQSSKNELNNRAASSLVFTQLLYFIQNIVK